MVQAKKRNEGDEDFSHILPNQQWLVNGVNEEEEQQHL